MKGKVQEIIRQMYLSLIESMNYEAWVSRCPCLAGYKFRSMPRNFPTSSLTGNLIELSFARQRVYIHFTY
ncbi:hypothetical protein L484_002468 [Morus notabilis]|uniref:Uncharacterized protein n=1 Tax=Morus notabilis TaxID=981085 RepID=W9SMK6_9ROSA|nr:hypothetical protein L484_002468 [Morus notabilis]